MKKWSTGLILKRGLGFNTRSSSTFWCALLSWIGSWDFQYTTYIFLAGLTTTEGCWAWMHKYLQSQPSSFFTPTFGWPREKKLSACIWSTSGQGSFYTWPSPAISLMSQYTNTAGIYSALYKQTSCVRHASQEINILSRRPCYFGLF